MRTETGQKIFDEYKKSMKEQQEMCTFMFESYTQIKQLLACIETASMHMTQEYPAIDRENIEKSRELLGRMKTYKTRMMGELRGHTLTNVNN